MEAIQTWYKGIKFRSRLEARWAVLFDTIGAEWEYEPEGFKSSDGTCYLPDFILHNVCYELTDLERDDVTRDMRRQKELEGAILPPKLPKRDIYIEVKGNMKPEDFTKWGKFIEPQFSGDFSNLDEPLWIHLNYKRPLYVVGKIPQNFTSIFFCEDTQEPIDVYYSDCFIRASSSISSRTALFRGNNGCIYVLGLPFVVEEKCEEYYESCVDLAQTQKAYTAARSARFEHGESGDITKPTRRVYTTEPEDRLFKMFRRLREWEAKHPEATECHRKRLQEMRDILAEQLGPTDLALAGSVYTAFKHWEKTAYDILCNYKRNLCDYEQNAEFEKQLEKVEGYIKAFKDAETYDDIRPLFTSQIFRKELEDFKLFNKKHEERKEHIKQLRME